MTNDSFWIGVLLISGIVGFFFSPAWLITGIAIMIKLGGSSGTARVPPKKSTLRSAPHRLPVADQTSREVKGESTSVLPPSRQTGLEKWAEKAEAMRAQAESDYIASLPEMTQKSIDRAALRSTLAAKSITDQIGDDKELQDHFIETRKRIEKYMNSQLDDRQSIEFSVTGQSPSQAVPKVSSKSNENTRTNAPTNSDDSNRISTLGQAASEILGLASTSVATIRTLFDTVDDNASSPGYKAERMRAQSNFDYTALFPEKKQTAKDASILIETPVVGNRSKARVAEMVRERRIEQLIHFTRCENLEMILDKGLLSVADLEMERLGVIRNDAFRLDGKSDAICLSVSFPNYRMFYKYRCERQGVEWAILRLNPAILWELECLFYRMNAADHRMRRRAKSELQGSDSFAAMFGDVEGVRPFNLNSCHPTNAQAEVLVLEPIDPRYILSVAFETEESHRRWAHLIGNCNVTIEGRGAGLFGARESDFAN
ncbi:MAG: DUF4433 domain-containing protein [Rhodobacteraceae bacterium]|nr:DUF4433 domain-containing protein [Paracoccaceae bacterium]